ncbi:MAG: hypothetical protein IIY56_05020, partial [Erysipelotrichaceae bacterium]|nr:hypothetical protein [Erysipelotrichaceae bacterium]
MVGLISGGLSRMIGFGVTAVWWWLVTVPLLSNYKQINYSSDQKGAVARAFSKIFKTVKKIA